MRRKHNLHGDEKGQSLVEFALVVPVLLLLLIGIMEFGWLLHAQITVTAAAREGARAGVIADLSPTERKERVGQAVDRGLSGFNFTETGYEATVNGTDITVDVEGTMEPLVGLMLPGPRDLRSSAVMRLE